MLKKLWARFKEGYPTQPTHIHTWTKWATWGIVYQTRQCSECGWQQLKDMERI